MYVNEYQWISMYVDSSVTFGTPSSFYYQILDRICAVAVTSNFYCKVYNPFYISFWIIHALLYQGKANILVVVVVVVAVDDDDVVDLD